MRIAIDIDDTITDTSIFTDELVLKNKLSDICKKDEYYTTGRYNWSQKQDDEFWDANIEYILTNAPIKEDAVEVINKLHDEGYEIYIITARYNQYSKDVFSITMNYLKRHNINYDEIIFNAHDKAKTCIENNIDVFIDDYIENIDSVSMVGIDTIVFDADHNKDSNKKRAYTWHDVYDLITRR